MLDDVAAPYPRKDDDLIVVEGAFPYAKDRIQAGGYKLAEDDQYLFFVPKGADGMAPSGVNVFEKSSVTFRPAKSDDPVLRKLERPLGEKGRAMSNSAE